MGVTIKKNRKIKRILAIRENRMFINNNHNFAGTCRSTGLNNESIRTSTAPTEKIKAPAISFNKKIHPPSARRILLTMPSLLAFSVMEFIL